MIKIIKALHYGKFNDNAQGYMYLTLRKFHWKMDNNTLLHPRQRDWVAPGNVARVQDTIKRRPQHNSVFVIKTYTGDDAQEYLTMFPKMKSVISARNPHVHNRKLINHTLRGMYNFYINHLQEAKDQSAYEVLCTKTPSGTFKYRFTPSK